MLISAIFSALQQDVGTDLSERLPKSMIERISLTVLLAPLLETFICQAIPFVIISLFSEQLHQWFRHVYIIASSLFFAFAHTYSNGYVLAMYVPGIVLAYSYVRSKEQHRPAFLTTMLVHMLHNGTALLWNYYLAGK